MVRSRLPAALIKTADLHHQERMHREARIAEVIGDTLKGGGEVRVWPVNGLIAFPKTAAAHQPQHWDQDQSDLGVKSRRYAKGRPWTPASSCHRGKSRFAASDRRWAEGLAAWTARLICYLITVG
jgi:hypothetical protein